MQAALDDWVADYNNDREHQSLGDVPPIKRFELARPASLEVIDGDVAIEEQPQPRPKTVSRRIDRAGRISILKHRYHVGRPLAGEAVTIESSDGLLHISYNGVVVATHARRHLIDDDDNMADAPSTRGARRRQPQVARSCGSSTSTDRSALPAPAIASAIASSDQPSESGSSVTPSRSPLTALC